MSTLNGISGKGSNVFYILPRGEEADITEGNSNTPKFYGNLCLLLHGKPAVLNDTCKAKVKLTSHRVLTKQCVSTALTARNIGAARHENSVVWCVVS